MIANSYSVALLLPYFGKFPNYFQLWLDSAKYNTFIDFLIFTDSEMSMYSIPSNVYVVEMTFQDVKNRISKVLPYSFKLENPYKLCDYRPLYGLIFDDYLQKYDFWGHCDPDIIWGDLSKYVTYRILANYDRIYASGHLTIYRNNSMINNCALGNPFFSFLKSKHVYTSNYSAHFDEGNLLRQLQAQVGMNIYEKIDCADVLYGRKPFVILLKGKKQNIDYFEYNKGHIYGYNCYEKIEFSYVHLQKREMSVCCTDSVHYYIYPNTFTSIEGGKNIAKTCLMDAEKYAKVQRKLLFLRRLKNIKQGAVKFRFLGFISKKYYRHEC